MAADSAGSMYVVDQGYSAITVINSAGRVLRNITHPAFSFLTSIARNASSGALYVCNSGANTVLELSATGAILTTYSGFNFPSGVSLDQHSFWVADQGHNAVVKVNGRALSDRETFLSPKGQPNFVSPNNVFVGGSKGNVFVCNDAASVIEMTTSGRYVRTYSNSGYDGSFEPEQVAVDDNNLLYVADTSGAVVVLNPSDTQVARYGSSSGLQSPVGIVLEKGKLYVSDQGNNQVVVLNPSSGAYLASYFQPLTLPSAVAIDKTGNLYITDTGNSRVVKLSKAGAQLNVTAPGFRHPLGIAVDADDNIYVVNTAGNSVMKLNKKFKLLATWTGGGLNGPSYCALNSAQTHLYVTDTGNAAIKVFTVSTGALFTTLTNANSIFSPLGIALNSNNQILLTNSGSGDIQLLSSSGASIATYDGSNGQDSSSLRGITVDSAGYIYAADNTNDWVVVLDGPTFLTTLNGAFVNPAGVTLNADRDVFVVDYNTANGKVYEYSPYDPK